MAQSKGAFILTWGLCFVYGQLSSVHVCLDAMIWSPLYIGFMLELHARSVFSHYRSAKSRQNTQWSAYQPPKCKYVLHRLSYIEFRAALIMHKTLIMRLKCSPQISININVLCCDGIGDWAAARGGFPGLQNEEEWWELNVGSNRGHNREAV